MKNHTTQDEKFLSQTQAALPTGWSKPQMSVTPLKEALTGAGGVADGGTIAQGS